MSDLKRLGEIEDDLVTLAGRVYQLEAPEIKAALCRLMDAACQIHLRNISGNSMADMIGMLLGCYETMSREHLTTVLIRLSNAAAGIYRDNAPKRPARPSETELSTALRSRGFNSLADRVDAVPQKRFASLNGLIALCGGVKG